jgi:hypothetical protein
MKIRGRDGAIREVDDDYILADGETLMVPLNFMDARRSMIHDGHGNVAGQRPGFLFCDDELTEAAREAAYQEYAATVSERWRKGQPKQTETAPQTFQAWRDGLPIEANPNIQPAALLAVGNVVAPPADTSTSPGHAYTAR